MNIGSISQDGVQKTEFKRQSSKDGVQKTGFYKMGFVLQE